MDILNIEFKAKVKSADACEQKLLTLQPKFIGEDLQTDTYFNVAEGRLKLREGNIENALIRYRREEVKGLKKSDIILYKHSPDKALKDILTDTAGIRSIVIKRRRIYFIENVKFHFDKVEGLGEFIEAEAIDNTGTIGETNLKMQCDQYIDFFGLKKEDFIDSSYGEMITPSADQVIS